MEVPWSNCFWMVSKILPMLQRWRFAVCGFWGICFFVFRFSKWYDVFFLVGFWGLGFLFFFGKGVVGWLGLLKMGVSQRGRWMLDIIYLYMVQIGWRNKQKNIWQLQ